MIGIIVAAKGILSTNALAIAEIHKIIAIISIRLPLLMSPMKFAMTFRVPVCSRPPTTMNNPMKNSSVL